MSDFVNSVTEAQQKLHADMRRDSDPRWSLLPVEDKPPRTWGWLIWPAILVSAAVSVGMFWG
jgi:hypothetical protein